MPIPPELPARLLSDPGLTFGAPPQQFPFNTINPATGLPYEGRGQYNGVATAGIRFLSVLYPVPDAEIFTSNGSERTRTSGSLRYKHSGAKQSGASIWAAAPPATSGLCHGPTIVSHYQEPWLIRRYNELPTQSQNGGFGVPEMSAHLHNFHNAPESDGGPCRYFFRGQYFDQYSTGQQAGFASTHQPNGDINESLSTLWYHDHRIDHTARTFIKGWRVFTSSSISSIRETRRQAFACRLTRNTTSQLCWRTSCWIRVPVTICFDTFNFKGLLGDISVGERHHPTVLQR